MGWLLSKIFNFFYKIFDTVTPKPDPKPWWRFGSSGRGNNWFGLPRYGWDSSTMNPGNVADRMRQTAESVRKDGLNLNIYTSNKPSWLDWLSPWFGIPSWVWYPALGLIATGAIYLGYSIWNDPYGSLLSTPSRPGNVQPTTPPSGPSFGDGGGSEAMIAGSTPGATGSLVGSAVQNGASGDSTGVANIVAAGAQGTANKVAALGAGVTAAYHVMTDWLDPFNWLDSGQTQTERLLKQDFFDRQVDPLHTGLDRKLYPHTVINPYATLAERWKLALAGETSGEHAKRMALLSIYRDNYAACCVPNHICTCARC